VIADSRSTREDIVRLIGIDLARIDVVPLGAGTLARAQPAPEADLRSRLELGDRPVALSLSAKRPHKNLPALIDAIASIPPERRPVLVVPGYPTAHEAELRARAAGAGIACDVRLPGWLSDADLEGLYALAAVFVFPSLYEGFGLPVLEAMCRGVPVACSNASSLPEVAGDAALMFDPRDVPAIAAAVSRLLDDRDLARDLAERGRRRCAMFSWSESAAHTIETYRRALSE
jgi:glycosyltransferase involved in cell wall biosynthesis